MLKWAVNEPRKSYLPPMVEQNDCICCCHQQDIIIHGCYSRCSLNMIGTQVLTTTTTTMTGDRRILDRRKSFDIRALRHDIESLVTNRAIYRARQSVTYISESTLI